MNRPCSSGIPLVSDRDRAEVGLQRWRESAAATAGTEVVDFIDSARGDNRLRPLLDGIFGNSPFLTALIEREAAFAARLFREGPDPALASVREDLDRVRADAAGGADPSVPLRRGKRRVALLTAVADLNGVWPLEQITAALSDFAAEALGCAARFLLGRDAGRGLITLPDPAEPQQASGLIVLGMGKLGGGELNYSSDIDLIVLYDSERIVAANPDDLQRQMVRLTRDLVTIMDARTPEGYVFRTDLRLRPDPSITPLALSVLAAETYYETLGQNWERAAMIKARPVAGDLAAGEAFLRHLKPYIWRKHLDFAQISDVHAIKRQIYAHHGGASIGLAGHNLKLGRGGIREIEFFAQTQQLIWGGRIPDLRVSTTVGALDALARHRMIEAGTAADLKAAYAFLRRVEHRLQMIDDEQTQVLPADRAGFEALARFLGYADTDRFEADLLDHLRTVEHHYARLFEESPAEIAGADVRGNLVFTGAEPDPDTLDTLRGLGFGHPATVDAAIRGWHRGRYRSTRSVRTRVLLTSMKPLLLKRIGAAPDPDACFLAFDRFLAALPAGTQLFAMLAANPTLLELLIEIMGRAPRLADHLARRPADLESVLTADFFEPPPDPAALETELAEALADADDFEDVLLTSRRWANDRKFQVGVQSLRGLLSPDEAGIAFSNIADAVLRALLPHVESDFAVRHGRIESCGMAVIALGKLGGREMTPTSDLDLIFVYTTPPDGATSTGEKPLAASQWFARLSQRLISAMTAMTPEGTLYEVDMRLRPSGKAGPLAVSFDSFCRYQRAEAWTWERMALTRARTVAGPPELAGAITTVIREVLTAPRDPQDLVVDVAGMRERMDAEHHTESIWEVKHLRGGLVDIEFLVQYLQLRHADEKPEILCTNTAEAIRALRRAGLLADETAGTLLEALELWQMVQSRIRLTIEGAIEARGPEDAPQWLRRALDGVAGLDVDQLGERMRTLAARARDHYQDIIGREAARAGAASDAAG